MIFPDGETVFRLGAFIGDAGADNFRKPVNIDGVDIERFFDFAAHGFGPGLGAEYADLERRFARVGALPAELIEDRQHVTRRHRDDVGPEVVDQLTIALGHAGESGN